MQQFNRKIEEQLKLLKEFRGLQAYADAEWENDRGLQAAYYDFLRERGFVQGSAKRPDKDAREKTSGLEDLGLITPGRRLSPAGEKLLEISESGDFDPDNFLRIPRDAMVYLTQLLKSVSVVDGRPVRPFVVLLYALSKLDYLTDEEFTYLLPLCISESTADDIISQIPGVRSGEKSIDDIILDTLMGYENYAAALDYFMTEPVSAESIVDVGMNRKSHKYDRPYYCLYKALHALYVEGDDGAAVAVLQKTKKISVGGLWRSLIFKSSNAAAVKKDPAGQLRVNVFDAARSEEAFKECFFKTMHLIKAKGLLYDYRDLNRRYLKTSGVVLFEDSQVRLDAIAGAFFNGAAGDLYKDAFSASPSLYDHSRLEDISPVLRCDEAALLERFRTETGLEVASLEDAYAAIEDERYIRLNRLIDRSFSTEQLEAMLGMVNERRDAELFAAVTDNADAPTIFEYLLGIIWYKLSGRSGRVLSFMKLSLDADLLPVTHAAGGEADIVYEYEEGESYPAHCLLLEATLSDSTAQRRMEMEPVSRHLGNHLIRHSNPASYCVFVAPYLHPQVISDFRGRKHMVYYDPQDTSRYIRTMKIIPLSTELIRVILRRGISYAGLYEIFDEAFRDEELLPLEWLEMLAKQITPE